MAEDMVRSERHRRTSRSHSTKWARVRRARVCVPARAAEALGRSAGGRCGVRHRPEGGRRAGRRDCRHRRRTSVEVAVVVGGGNIFRGLAGSRRGHGPRPGRLHRHAGHRHERAGPAGRLRAPRHLLACAERHHHAGGLRALHPPPRRCATWRRAAWSSWPPARATPTSPPTPRPRFAPASSTWTACMKATKVDGVYDSDPTQEPGRQALRPHQLHGRAVEGPQRHGLHGHVAVHGQPSCP